jgi:hypothetical protein
VARSNKPVEPALGQCGDDGSPSFYAVQHTRALARKVLDNGGEGPKTRWGAPQMTHSKV